MVDIPWNQQKFPKQPESWQGVMAQDSVQLGAFQLIFTPAQGVFQPATATELLKDSITSSYTDPYYKSMAYERYLETHNDSLFERTDDTLTLFTSQKQWKVIDSDSQKYCLSDLLIAPDYYLIKAFYNSGTSYLLFNHKSGSVNYLWGLPHLAPDADAMLVSSNDQSEQYSANGLQYFTISSDSVQLQWEIGLENWGPKRVQWLGTDTVLIMREYLTPTESDEVYVSDRVQMVIKKSEPNL
jgi:hypothetical protein